MFEISYRISLKWYDNFIGEDGYYKMRWHDKTYGEIFPEELDGIMGIEYLYDWFKSMTSLALVLAEKNYAAWNDIESPCLWIEFVKKGEQLFIRLVRADKQMKGRLDYVVHHLENIEYMDVSEQNQPINYVEFVDELLLKCGAYLKELELLNHAGQGIEEIKLLHELKSKLEKANSFPQIMREETIVAGVESEVRQFLIDSVPEPQSESDLK